MAIEKYSRTVQEIITAVSRQFGDEAEIQINGSDIIRWINQAQLEIAIANDTINEGMATASIIQDQDKYPLLTDPAFSDVARVHTVLYKGRPVKNVSFNEALTYIIGQDSSISSGTPEIWYIKSGVLNFWPPPNENVSDGFTVYFTRTPKSVESAGSFLSVPDTFYNAVLQYVIAQAMELDENFQAAGIKLQQFEKSVNLQQNETVEQNGYFPSITQDPEDYL